MAARVTGALLARLRVHGPPKPPADGLPDLSPRELAVLRHLVAGYDNVEIAKLLYVSASTIKHQVSSSLEKLGVNNRVQPAVLAVRLGLIRTE